VSVLNCEMQSCLGANETKKRPGTPEAVPGARLSFMWSLLTFHKHINFNIIQDMSSAFRHLLYSSIILLILIHITHNIHLLMTFHDSPQNGGVRDTLFLFSPLQVGSHKLLRLSFFQFKVASTWTFRPTRAPWHFMRSEDGEEVKVRLKHVKVCQNL
jgi:hypothetical protein